MPRSRRRKTAAGAPQPVRRAHSPASPRAVQQADAPATPTGAAGRAHQLRQAWTLTREADPRLPLYVFVPATVVLAVLVVVGVFTGHAVALSILGVLGGILAGTAIFGRRATATMYSTIEGQVGAAAGVLQNLRGEWHVTPVVAFTRNQDLVHRVAGRPGVVFVAEGPSITAQRQLVTDQKRRVNRVAPEISTHEIYVGDGEGQVPLRRLQSTVMRLPRSLRSGEIRDLDYRLKALGGTNMPLPKGPMPKNVRMPRGPGAPRVR